MLVMLLSQISQHEIFAAGWKNLAWCLALPAAGALLWRDAETLPPRLSRLAHLSLFWMILLALAAELFWFGKIRQRGMAAWGSGLMMAAGPASSFSFMRRSSSAMAIPKLARTLRFSGDDTGSCVLVVLLVLTNLQDGVVYRQTWLPLVNPLEEGAALRYWDSLYFIAFRSAFSGADFGMPSPGRSLHCWRLASGG